MARAPYQLPRPSGFAVRRLEDLLPPPAGRDWDVRFVSAVLLFYGLMGASFYLVDWLNDEPPAPVPALETARPDDGASDGARFPYLMRLPRLLKDQAAGDGPREPR